MFLYWLVLLFAMPHKCSWHRALLGIRIYKKGDSWKLNITSALSVAMTWVI